MAHNSIRFGYPDRAAVFHCVDPGVRCTSFFFVIVGLWSKLLSPFLRSQKVSFRLEERGTERPRERESNRRGPRQRRGRYNREGDEEVSVKLLKHTHTHGFTLHCLIECTYFLRDCCMHADCSVLSVCRPVLPALVRGTCHVQIDGESAVCLFLGRFFVGARSGGPSFTQAGEKNNQSLSLFAPAPSSSLFLSDSRPPCTSKLHHPPLWHLVYSLFLQHERLREQLRLRTWAIGRRGR